MNADDARIKDTISNLRKVEKHLRGTNTRVALLLKRGLDELEALLAAPPLGESPTLTERYGVFEADRVCLINVTTSIKSLHRVCIIEPDKEFQGCKICWTRREAEGQIRKLNALLKLQPPRVEEMDLKQPIELARKIRDAFLEGQEPSDTAARLAMATYLIADDRVNVRAEAFRVLARTPAPHDKWPTTRNKADTAAQADREHQIRAKALEEAARIVESEFLTR